MLRPILLISLVFALVLLSLITLSGAILALSLPLVLYLGWGLLDSPPRPELALERGAVERRWQEGDSAAMTVRLTNQGPRLAEVQFHDLLPPGLTIVSGHATLTTALAPGQTVSLTYTLSGRRGYYELGQLEIRARETFGLFEQRLRLDGPAPSELFFAPRIIRLVNPIPIRPRQTKVFAGYIPARVGGSGADFYGVRGYQPGDSLRHLNWRATARHSETFFTNEFEQERVADVGLILDARRRSLQRAGSNALFDFSLQATAALADAFLTAGNRVSLLVYGSFLDWTLPGYGKLQRERILLALARADIGDSQVFDRLENLPTRLFPPKSQLVLISPLLVDDTLYLNALAGRGYSLLIISPDPVAFEAGRLPSGPALTLAARAAQVERRLLFRRLQQAGAWVVNWDVQQPLDQVAAMRLNRPIRLSHLIGFNP